MIKYFKDRNLVPDLMPEIKEEMQNKETAQDLNSVFYTLSYG